MKAIKSCRAISISTVSTEGGKGLFFLQTEQTAEVAPSLTAPPPPPPPPPSLSGADFSFSPTFHETDRGRAEEEEGGEGRNDAMRGED